MPAPLLAQEEVTECQDTWPEDVKRPEISATFPLRGTSGHVAELKIVVKHKPGEQVFPSGLALAPESPEYEWLKNASFVVPDAHSAVKTTLSRSEPKEASAEAQITTTVTLPLVPLPKDAGRKELTLPRLPIAISRASGTLHRICTDPRVITVEDPLASEPNPAPKPDPEPRPQIEVWESLRDAVLIALAALPLALLIAWLLLRFRKHFKKEPAPPPPIPPWDEALAALRTLDQRNLLAQGEFEEFLDSVCDTLRDYLGKRYGFDGLESTTRELLRQMNTLAPDFPEEKAVRSILQRADLVKFARRLPSAEECQEAFNETQRIVIQSRPLPKRPLDVPQTVPKGAQKNSRKPEANERSKGGKS